jgi:hypothetical protein
LTDYFLPDGTVLHLRPQQRDDGAIHPAGATVRMTGAAIPADLRDAAVGSEGGLVTAISSVVPLFSGARPPREKTMPYLSELQARLEEARRSGPIRAGVLAIAPASQAAGSGKEIR